MLDLGFQELIVIFAVAIIVFGPKRLPELSRSLGKGIGQLRKALFDVKYEINKEMRIMDEDAGIKTEDPVPDWKRQALNAIYGDNPPAGVKGPEAGVNPSGPEQQEEGAGSHEAILEKADTAQGEAARPAEEAADGGEAEDGSEASGQGGEPERKEGEGAS